MASADSLNGDDHRTRLWRLAGMYTWLRNMPESHNNSVRPPTVRRTHKEAGHISATGQGGGELRMFSSML